MANTTYYKGFTLVDWDGCICIRPTECGPDEAMENFLTLQFDLNKSDHHIDIEKASYCRGDEVRKGTEWITACYLGLNDEDLAAMRSIIDQYWSQVMGFDPTGKELVHES